MMATAIPAAAKKESGNLSKLYLSIAENPPFEKGGRGISAAGLHQKSPRPL